MPNLFELLSLSSGIINQYINFLNRFDDLMNWSIDLLRSFVDLTNVCNNAKFDALTINCEFWQWFQSINLQ